MGLIFDQVYGIFPIINSENIYSYEYMVDETMREYTKQENFNIRNNFKIEISDGKKIKVLLEGRSSKRFQLDDQGNIKGCSIKCIK